MTQLQLGQVYELHDVYVGSKGSLPTRIVACRCTEEQKKPIEESKNTNITKKSKRS